MEKIKAGDYDGLKKQVKLALGDIDEIMAKLKLAQAKLDYLQDCCDHPETHMTKYFGRTVVFCDICGREL
jgi:hypothetical protein